MFNKLRTVESGTESYIVAKGTFKDRFVIVDTMRFRWRYAIFDRHYTKLLTDTDFYCRYEHHDMFMATDQYKDMNKSAKAGCTFDWEPRNEG